MAAKGRKFGALQLMARCMVAVAVLRKVQFKPCRSFVTQSVFFQFFEFGSAVVESSLRSASVCKMVYSSSARGLPRPLPASSSVFLSPRLSVLSQRSSCEEVDSGDQLVPSLKIACRNRLLCRQHPITPLRFHFTIVAHLHFASLSSPGTPCLAAEPANVPKRSANQ